MRTSTGSIEHAVQRTGYRHRMPRKTAARQTNNSASWSKVFRRNLDANNKISTFVPLAKGLSCDIMKLLRRSRGLLQPLLQYMPLLPVREGLDDANVG